MQFGIKILQSMGKIIKRGVRESEKFENKSCRPEASMSLALLGRASCERRERGLVVMPTLGTAHVPLILTRPWETTGTVSSL